ncbi:unnamed protein product [Absidia cylindrospora]
MAAAAQAHLPHLYNHNPTTHPAQFSNGNNNSNHSNHSSPRLAHPPLATPGAAPVASTPTTSTSHSLNASPLSTPPPLPPPTSAASLVGLHHHLSHIPAPAPPVPVTTAPSEEEPLYVNAKQYHCILKRRTARLRLEELNRIAEAGNLTYMKVATNMPCGDLAGLEVDFLHQVKLPPWKNKKVMKILRIMVKIKHSWSQNSFYIGHDSSAIL